MCRARNTRKTSTLISICVPSSSGLVHYFEILKMPLKMHVKMFKYRRATAGCYTSVLAGCRIRLGFPRCSDVSNTYSIRSRTLLFGIRNDGAAR